MAFFARARGDAEFMLIYAFVAGHCGGVGAPCSRRAYVPAATITARMRPAAEHRTLERPL